MLVTYIANPYYPQDTMSNEPVEIIRESTRNLLQLNRRIHKDEETNSRRAIQEIRINKETILDIANKLKTKSCITITDLQTLKNGLIENSNYVEAVLSVHGALRGLIRELTGHNVKKQCLAAGCCCNLALGDSRACITIAKAAGSYLTTALDNLTTDLAVSSAWTLGNLAGADPRVCNILTSQGAFAKLSEVYNNEDIQDAALYALVHFTYQMRDDLRTDQLIKILQTLTKLDISMMSAQLLFIASCHEHFSENVTEELLQKILEQIPSAFEYHTQKCPQIKKCCKLLYLVRTLANMDKMYAVILNYFTLNNMSGMFKSLLNSNKCVSDSCMWLLGNLYNFCDDKQFFNMLTT
ncbi:uncharacterized protein LOC124534198 [Vanessa cardui]|uniref:uncharacterized protein LOC124534198 n=1 Tax=Vanessa cardui TaxID=171605 RepID=UPI001F144C34|nr:uncharacterized protein LOC124534198 [Vanessa cardui]